MAMLSCPTTGEGCAFVALLDEERELQSDMFERCVSNDIGNRCGHYVLLAESIQRQSIDFAVEGGETNA